ncbi:MAG: hypothetical protein HQ565_01790 [Bacteroidetes bacterium]|nr:hypothetical protein [Bacteroidota bacterium]
MKKTTSAHNRHFHSYILVMLLLLIPLTGFSQWQANMINSISGGEKHYKVYSNLDQYSYSFTEDEISGVVIVSPGINQTAILNIDEKMVHYTTCDGMMSSMNDPVQAYNNYKKHGEEKVIGTETIAGYECIKKELYQGDQKLFTQWFSEKLKFPVRIEGHFSENAYMQLENIQKWDLIPSVFIVPADYIEVDEQLEPINPPLPDK